MKARKEDERSEIVIEKRQLGKSGPNVGCLGYGAMVLEGYCGASDDQHAVGTIHRALDVGMNMIDTTDAYGSGHNETLVGRAHAERVEENAKAADIRLTPELLTGAPDSAAHSLHYSRGFSAVGTGAASSGSFGSSEA